MSRIEFKDVVVDEVALVSFEYFGWRVYCSRDTALLDRLVYTADVYEKREIKALRREVTRTSSGCVLDVGANIGLISLPLLRFFPKLEIHAFEPGPVQGRFLEISIARNGLGGRLHLNKVALADTMGEVDFHIHGSKDASGDGIFDTGTAGVTSLVRVPVMRLDDWWTVSGQPEIRLIKIDVEGGELLVLNGAKELLRRCRPSMMLELSRIHMMPYAYGAMDVFDWLNSEGYLLFTLGGEEVGRERLTTYLENEVSFIARPKMSAGIAERGDA